jgi:gluconolactonase
MSSDRASPFLALVTSVLVTFDASPATAQSSEQATPLAIAAFLEGPAASDDGTLFFTDLFNNRIWQRNANGKMTVFRISANYANGLAIDAAGGLLAAENGDPQTGTPARITRTDLTTGAKTVLVDSFDGKPFNSPNDLVADGKGRIYFTDWSRPDFLPAMPAMPAGARNPFGVYRIDPDGSTHRVLVTPQIEAPNGIMVSPDDCTLYLVESNRNFGGRRRIVAYAISPDGALGEGRLFHEFSPGRSADGLAVDTAGRVWAAAGLNSPRPGGETMATRAGIYVFRPDGHLATFVPVGEDLITNVAFGGPSRKTAFVTAGKTIFSIASDVVGTRR